MNRIEKGFPGRRNQAAKSTRRSVAWAQPNQPGAAAAGPAKLPERLSRRDFLARVGVGAALALPLLNLPLVAQNLKDGVAPIPEPHFPNRLFLFVWRNWELANTDRLAKVLNTSQKSVLKLGAMLGLPAKPRLTEDQLRRIYITVIRQNWHVLPHEQLIELLSWDRARYEFTLKEDDFLWSKLGLGVKPTCERLRYQEPTITEAKRATEIRRVVQDFIGAAFEMRGEPPFHFIADLGSTQPVTFSAPRIKPSASEISLRGCTVLEPEAAAAQALIRTWVGYLQAAFGTKLKTAAWAAGVAGPTIRFEMAPGAEKDEESYEIHSGDEGLRVVASDPAGLRQAVYHLQDLCEEHAGPLLPRGTWQRSRRVTPRYIYPYFALYGDPLLDRSIDPFPEGYLEKLGRRGVDGVWIQAVLRSLAPSRSFPEFGKQWEVRLENLRRFVQRARAYGLKIYLYINEPRLMSREFFEKHPEVRGTSYAGAPNVAQEFAICTSVPEVRAWLSESLTHVFTQVPQLGGIFCITASENLTNCFAHGEAQFCPRCSKRQGWEVVTELLETFRDGVHKGNPAAEVIAWDWGWGWVKNGADAGQTIAHIPKGVQLLSVSEWGKQYTRGGVSLSVAEYSMSVVGPGANALDHWKAAREHQITTLAKVQFNNTWEISAVPYIPVPLLVQQHLKNLLAEQVSGLMLSWTLGGYPSPNLEVAKEYYYSPEPSGKEVLERVARRRYGAGAAPYVLSAWECFSTAFQEFPYGVVAGYSIPTQHGPSNLLRLKPTGYTAAMILYPYDDLKKWLGPYSPEIAQQQFEKLTQLWEGGLDHFRQALLHVPKERAVSARKDLGIAETCWLHYRSVANQIRFYSLRQQLKEALPATRSSRINEMKQIARSEMELARRLYTISRQDSTIGYEASNHYYYRPLDLAEKVLNCEHLIRCSDTD
jgi:hypothetical protein